MYASYEVSRVHVSNMHGSKAKGVYCNGFVTQCELECPSYLKKVHANLEKIGSHRVFNEKVLCLKLFLLVSSFEHKQVVQDLCECSFFVDGFHYKALDNNIMAKCKQNPFSEGCRESAQDIQDVNVQGEGDCSMRNAYQS